MQVGETITLKATVLPDNTDDKIITWTSSKTDVATVNDGTVSAVAAGKTVITAKAGEKTATCEITVTARPSTPAIGDYYYSDGSYSSALETGKDPIGILFWVGDPTKDDAILRQEHPGCTHGLVVALHETDSPWQAYYSDYDATVSAWLGNNLTGYTSLLAGYKMDDNLNKMLGYNNTKAIEAFNADEANEWWEVEIVTYVQEYRDKTKAPENSSDWYAPSVKELSLLCTGVFDGNIDDLGYEDEPDTANSLAINERLATIGSASQLSNITYWTASEEDGRTAKIINFKSGIVASSNKGNDSNLIPVCPQIRADRKNTPDTNSYPGFLLPGVFHLGYACLYFTSIWRVAAASSSTFFLGMSMVITPFSTLAEIFSRSMLSGSSRLCWNCV